MKGWAPSEITRSANFAAEAGKTISELVKPLCGPDVKYIKVCFVGRCDGKPKLMEGFIKPGVNEFTVWGA